MTMFLPWSESTLQEMFELFSKKKMPILDLEMSALCGHRLVSGGCLYCDSPTGKPHLNEPTVGTLLSFISEAKNDLDLRWIYICGLGEPFDDPKLKTLVKFASKLGISTSFFTNGINYTYEDLRFLFDHQVSLLIKCDSLNHDTFGKLLGTSDRSIVDTIYKTIEMAIDIGFTNSNTTGTTRLALSIVPTKHNKTDILDVFNYCKHHNIYPLLAQLEHAGRGRILFDELSLNDEELLKIKASITELYEAKYEIPVCPASITGIHINNIGNCVIHETTGLSCLWFELSEPQFKIVGNINDSSPSNLWKTVQAYRKTCLANVKCYGHDFPTNIFGGCGGNKILEVYFKAMSTQ